MIREVKITSSEYSLFRVLPVHILGNEYKLLWSQICQNYASFTLLWNKFLSILFRVDTFTEGVSCTSEPEVTKVAKSSKPEVTKVAESSMFNIYIRFMVYDAQCM